MIDSKWREPYQIFIIDPVLKSPVAALSPALLTGLACCFGLLTCVFLTFQFTLLAFICLTLSGFCDTLDGSLARHQMKSCPKGAALDITSDRFVEFVIILGLYLFDPSRAFLTLLMLGASLLCVTTFLVVGIFESNTTEKSFHYSPGLIERAEAFVFFALMILFPNSFTLLAYTFSALVFVTAGIRLYQFSKHASN